MVAVDVLDPEQSASAAALIAAAETADGVPPLSDQTLLRAREPGVVPGNLHILRYGGRQLVGYGFLTDGVGELVVHPAHRRQGHGRRLVESALSVRAAGPATELRLWAHGNHPGAVRLAEEFELRAARELWQLRRQLGGEVTATCEIPRLPDHVRLRSFRTGTDEPAWLALNRRAFAGHPEQEHWTLADLLTREREPWFDPEGFLLAENSNGRLLGFHWTKIHGQRLGEVHVLGVDPESRGLKLGRILLLAGLQHLARRGCDEAMLYVDATNRSAFEIYRAFNFSRANVDVQYVTSAATDVS